MHIQFKSADFEYSNILAMGIFVYYAIFEP